MRAEYDRQAKRKEQNVKTWRTLVGLQKEAAVPRIATRKIVEFDSRHFLKFTDSAGAFIDALIGICFARPDYLRPIHARRHIVLLNELKEFSFDRYQWNGREEKCKVANLSIRELDLAIRQWIFSFFADNWHVLMPSYALDTARFVQSHIEGHYDYDPELWEIKPMVELPKEERRHYFRFLDAQFKKEFTESMGTLSLCGTVPENCRIVDMNGNEILKAGAEFLFNTRRCHLSSGFYDHTELTCKEADNQPYDLHEEFRFMGAAFVIAKSSPPIFATKQSLSNYPDIDFRGINIELPAYWIDGAVELPDRYPRNAEAKPKIIDVPHWDVEVG